MAVFPHDTLRQNLQDQAARALPDIIKPFWDPVVEGFEVCTELIHPNSGNPHGIEYAIVVGPGRVYLAPRAGAPC